MRLLTREESLHHVHMSSVHVVIVPSSCRNPCQHLFFRT